MTDSAAPWDTIVPGINELINQYNDLLAQRGGGGEDDGGGSGGGGGED